MVIFRTTHKVYDIEKKTDVKILLLGEYSSVHCTLAEGLRDLGHDVTVASNGDFWREYPRDINLARDNKFVFLWRLLRALPRMKGYDIVQLVNPMFMELKAERLFPIYNYLRRNNGRIVLCAVGDDHYCSYVHRHMKPMRYSDYNYGAVERCTAYAGDVYNDWVGTEKERLNRYIAADCDAIVAGSYEYWLPYSVTEDTDNEGRKLCEKLHLVPYPFKMPAQVHPEPSEKLRVFIGISKERAEFKGTDIMLRAAKDLLKAYPERMELRTAGGLPFAEYSRMMDGSDVLLDQLYSYGPGMNALLSLSKGIVTLTGGEPEHYGIMGENECRPIIAVQPDYESVYHELEKLVLHPERLAELKNESRRYVARNYDYHKIAKQYEEIYHDCCNRT